MRKVTLALVIVLIAVTACSISSRSSSRKERLKLCLYIPKIVITPDNSITKIQGEIENKCNEDIRRIKIIANGSEYPGGPVIGYDEEYIEDLAKGDKKNFEAQISDPNRGIKAARIEIDEIYLP